MPHLDNQDRPGGRLIAITGCPAIQVRLLHLCLRMCQFDTPRAGIPAAGMPQVKKNPSLGGDGYKSDPADFQEELIMPGMHYQMLRRKHAAVNDPQQSEGNNHASL